MRHTVYQWWLSFHVIYELWTAWCVCVCGCACVFDVCLHSGNMKSLKNGPQSRNVDIYKNLQKFRLKYYLSQYMTLAVQSQGAHSFVTTNIDTSVSLLHITQKLWRNVWNCWDTICCGHDAKWHAKLLDDVIQYYLYSLSNNSHFAALFPRQPGDPVPESMKQTILSSMSFSRAPQVLQVGHSKKMIGLINPLYHHCPCLATISVLHLLWTKVPSFFISSFSYLCSMSQKKYTTFVFTITLANIGYLTLSYLTLPYLILPYHSGQAFYCLVLRPRADTMHIPILTQKLQKPSAGFCNPEKNTPVFLSWSPGPKKTFQRICIVSQRWHSNCLKDAGWCLPPLYRMDNYRLIFVTFSLFNPERICRGSWNSIRGMSCWANDIWTRNTYDCWVYGTAQLCLTSLIICVDWVVCSLSCWSLVNGIWSQSVYYSPFDLLFQVCI